MINALLSGVTGLKAHQAMLDVAGNNLSNVNTSGFKASRITFASLLSETLQEASAATDNLGGTNPLQIGNGVKVASVDRDTTQGSLINTGNSLDMAIEGSGQFVLHDGEKEVYTRVGAFSVDSNYYLVDPGTGYRVQRIGSTGVSEGFQGLTDTGIRIPYDVALAAKETSRVTYGGNLSADESDPTRHIMTSGIQYTKNQSVINDAARVDELDQTTGLDTADVIRVSGYLRDGTKIQSGGNDYVEIALHNGSNYKTISDILTEINAVYRDPNPPNTQWSEAKLINGEIRLEETAAGYTKTDTHLTYVPNAGGTFELPSFLKILSAGGETTKQTNVEVFDSQGNAHVISASFVKQNASNEWDLVLTTISGEGVKLEDRRIEGLQFLPDGSYGGLDAGMGDEATFRLYFPNDLSSQKTIQFDFGDVGEFDGLTQFGGSSTAAANSQDGYGAGWLSSLSVGRGGVVTGVFTNGIRRDIAALKIATFRNAAGLKDIGNGYFVASANSGDAVPNKALEGGAGVVHGGSLEKSNVEIAGEFVNLIQAQNGFQANARTISVTNDVLRELSRLIR